MGSILNDYLKKRLGYLDLKKELQRLIGEYNAFTGRTLFVYAADATKGRMQNGHDVQMTQQDFYIIQDILRESTSTSIDFYIETPGGSGEAAEEIARFLRKKFPDGVNFVIAAEAKSAGTILALSGDNIYMTETGSLGPIDAQVRIGRFTVSAHDYKEWIDEKETEAKKGPLNHFDAIMIGQISPGEIKGVLNVLEFAKDLVKEWLAMYKFKNWTVTKTKGEPVDEEKRKSRASEVAEKLCNHTEWRTHGRSLKIDDLEGLLEIENLDNTPDLVTIVYKIRTVIRLLFDGSSNYKLYYMDDFELSKGFVASTPTPSSIVHPGSQVPGIQKNQPPVNKGNIQQQMDIEGVEIKVRCLKCSKEHAVPGYMDISSEQLKLFQLPTNKNIKDNDILECDNCTFAIDLKPIKNQFENNMKKKLIFK